MVASLLVERTLKAAEGYLPSSVVAALHLLTQTGSTSEIIDECRDLLNKGKETIFTATATFLPLIVLATMGGTVNSYYHGHPPRPLPSPAWL